MLTKKLVNKQINDLPNEFSLDELIKRLLIVQKVNQGMSEAEKGNTITEVELDKILN